jgi:hypothetical protein
MSVSKQPQKTEPLPFQKENVATNQQNVPLPYFAGERVIAGRWISPALNQIRQQATGAGKKG